MLVHPDIPFTTALDIHSQAIESASVASARGGGDRQARTVSPRPSRSRRRWLRAAHS